MHVIYVRLLPEPDLQIFFASWVIQHFWSGFGLISWCLSNWRISQFANCICQKAFANEKSEVHAIIARVSQSFIPGFTAFLDWMFMLSVILQYVLMLLCWLYSNKNMALEAEWNGVKFSVLLLKREKLIISFDGSINLT